MRSPRRAIKHLHRHWPRRRRAVMVRRIAFSASARSTGGETYSHGQRHPLRLSGIARQRQRRSPLKKRRDERRQPRRPEPRPGSQPSAIWIIQGELMSLIPTEQASIVLHGHTVSLGSEIGRSFVEDCARYTEGLMSEAETRSRW